VSRLLVGFDDVASRKDYAAAARRGGYPEVLSLDDPWRTMWLDSHIERMTLRDAQSVSERVSSQRLRAVLRLLAANQAGELVKAHIDSDLSAWPLRVDQETRR
jgi:predicted AAA+ superfamily ATPase